MRLERFQVQLVQDLGTRLVVRWDAGTIVAREQIDAVRVAEARVPSQLRHGPTPFRWRVVPAQARGLSGRSAASAGPAAPALPA